MANNYSYKTHRILLTFVHIIFRQIHSNYKLDHNSAIAGDCCHENVPCNDIYFSLQMLNRIEPFLQIFQPKFRLLCNNA